MILTAPKMGSAVLLAIASAWAIAPVSPQGQEQGGNAAEEKALDTWRKVYHLERDQVLKRVPPPFIPERLIDAEKRFPFLKQNRARRGFPLTLIYRERGGALQNPSVAFTGGPDAKGRQLIHLITEIAEMDSRDVEGPKELLETEVSGDFLVRNEAPKADIVAALETILWLECELKIKLTLREVACDVVVARGKFTFKPRDEGRREIDLYGEEVDPKGSGTGTGDFAEFLDKTGRFLQPAKRVVNEVEVPPTGDVSWRFHFADRDRKLVLKHLEEQTGLTFTPEKRKIRILFVEPGK